MLNVENAAPFAVLLCAVIALIFSCYQFYSVKKKPEGTDKMKSISLKIRKGAMAYLKRQYKTVGIFFAIMFIILLILALSGFLTIFVPFAFLTGHLRQFQNRERRTGGLKQGLENRICLRLCYGTDGCRIGTFGHQHLVYPAEIRI